MPGICQAVEGKSITKDHEISRGGNNLYFRTKYLPIVFDDGVQGVSVILEDITETYQIRQMYEKIMQKKMITGKSLDSQALSDISQSLSRNSPLGTGMLAAHQILNNIQDLVIELDTSLKPRYISLSHKAILGYDPEDLKGIDFISLIHSDDREKITGTIKEAIKNKKTIRVEIRVRHKDGHYIWLESFGKPVFDEAGTYIGGIISSRDISDRVRQHEEFRQNSYELEGGIDSLLRKSQEIHKNTLDLIQPQDAGEKEASLFRAIIDSAYHPIFLVQVDPDGTPGTYIDANEPACTFLGYSRQELLGKSADDLLVRTARGSIMLLLARQNFREAKKIFELTYTDDEGKIIPLEITIRLLLSKPENIAVVAIRENMQGVAAKDDKKLSSLVENIPAMIFVKDDSLNYVSCNENYAHDLGIAAEAIEGKSDFDFFSRDLAEIYRADDKSVLQTGNTYTFERKYFTNNQVFWVLFIKTPLKDNTGNISGILGIFYDITDKKTREDALLLANQQLNLLTDITRHDIRNRATAIQLSLGLAAKKFSDPELTSLFETAEKNIREIISQVEFTKMYQNIGAQEPHWQDLDNLLSQLHVTGQHYPLLQYLRVLKSLQIHCSCRCLFTFWTIRCGMVEMLLLFRSLSKIHGLVSSLFGRTMARELQQI